MFKKIILYLTSGCFFWVYEGSALAATSVAKKTTDHYETATQSLEIQTKKLEKELNGLRSQIKALKQSSHSVVKAKSSPVIHRGGVVPQQFNHDLSHRFFLIGTPIVNSPNIGMTTAYNGTDLVVNQPYIKEDLYLLKQRKAILSHNRYLMNPSWQSNTPLVNISGKLEAQVMSGNTLRHASNTSDLNLKSAEIDTEIFVNQWITGLMAFVYDNRPKAHSPRRIENSNVFVDRAFLTLGDLHVSPFYGTVGQFYVPFGCFSSAMITSPLTKKIGRVQARAFSIGFMKRLNPANDLNLTAFVFRGPSKISENDKRLNNYGADVTYTFIQPHWSLSLGSSYIRNIADAMGMQRNGANSEKVFGGFATNNTTEIFQPVGGGDIRGELKVGSVNLRAEYVTALSAFSDQILAFGTSNQLHGARPRALSTELIYNFDLNQKPSRFAIGYSQSQEALAFLLPKQRYSATFSTSIWRNTIESIEFSHDLDYDVFDQARGGSGFDPITGTGKTANTITFQLGLYF